MEVFLSAIQKFFLANYKFILGIIINVIILWIVCRLIDAFRVKIEQRLRLRNSTSPLLNLMPILTKITKLIVIFFLLAAFLQSFGYNVTSLIAGFGITGLAVGFAAKDTIGNIFGSIGLLADKVYKIGEYIKYGDIEGTVESVNLRSTSLRTVEGFVVNIPNNVLSNMAITNLTQVSKRRLDVKVDIEYGTSDAKIDRALEILKEIAKDEKKIKDGAISFVDEMAPSSIVVRLVCYTGEVGWEDFTLLKGKVLKEIIQRFRSEGIEFAFPSTSVYMASND